ncbi:MULTISPECIES: DUF952 domain-containing protein [Bacillus cereus group]|jgi:uncharacterized protein (DUF952 family)|uniref:DUF952 domain-containing protein n=1 Tax=Bacillus thuringiensis subsp. medellin TaxID=79672 RepID=A0A9X6RHK6_BACTV|nr:MULTISPECIES: DUF952 domain-containing protein [Bacillus cereus group]MDM5370780.1 DUF952 domain-containing protein [Bacillus bombysepticus]MCR6787207.1 DUF952 domain-containing protein [Bacillus thuringiensis]MCR6823108.1 DUF952 domain-containing protein [Bacillus thuringiensis]MCR6829283.1 DUF952 domain-containing protein [Bacillus thuringiensis]MEB8930658.1 DUF952 domain-containing protein [Bacillus cereus]
MITKVITKSNWEIAKTTGEINEESLIEEGFIHCSLLDQALKVAEKYFKHEEDVLLLTIDPALLKAEVKYELASNGQEYPHVYGVINVEAIVEVVPFSKEKGEFILLKSVRL